MPGPNPHQKGALFISPPTEVPTYDQDGNLTSDARWTYIWDGENRLIAQEEKTGFTVLPTSSVPVKRTRLEFSYDAQGRRIGKQTFIATGSGGFVLQQSLVHLYDGWNMIAEIDTTSSAQLLRSSEWGTDVSGTMTGAGGVGGLLIERFHTTPVLGVHAPMYDGNGNVTELVNLTNGSVSAHYEYGAFGETISMDGGAVAEANSFRFSTKYQDTETGLYNYGYRYYDAVNGRWLNRDPIGIKGGMNLYGMVGNDPVNQWDYLGFAPANFKTLPPKRINGDVDIKVDGVPLAGKTFAAKCECEVDFKITKALFRADPTNKYLFMIIVMEVIPKNKGACTSFKTMQFVRGMKRTNADAYVPQQDQGGTERSRRSVPNSSLYPDQSGWQIDSPEGNAPAAGEPFLDDTPFGTQPDVGNSGRFFDTPAVRNNEGFEAYTCLACNKGGSTSIVACLHWGFEAEKKNNQIVGKLTVNPKAHCAAKGNPLGTVTASAIKQWNTNEKIQIKLSDP